jgi:hypothetical protein
MKEVNRVNQLIAEMETVSSDALKNALQRQLELEQKAQEEELLEQFNKAKSYVNLKVQNLRQIREIEKAAVKAVKKADAAYSKFKETGDFQAFMKAVNVY